MDTKLRLLDITKIEEIKEFFCRIFTKEPWNDDWSNKNQLHAYMMDLAGNHNSLMFGLFEKETMVGLSIGNVKHWYAGTTYHIDEFCIRLRFKDMVSEQNS